VFTRNHQHRFQNPADDGSGAGAGAGAGGGNAPAITPELQAIIDSRVNDAVSGLKAKNGELIGKLKDATTNLQRFDGIDPDAVKTMLSRFASDEEAGLIKAGKIDEVLNKRTERMQAEHLKAVKAENERAAKAEGKAAKLADRTLSASLKDAAAKAGVHPTALDDIALRGRGLWRLNDDGDAVAMNGEDIVLGKDGKTPLTPTEWVDSLREVAPHFWPKAQGSDALGSNTDKAAARKGKAPERKEFQDDIAYSKAAARYHAQAEA
jgi:hypothetical protein